MGYNPDMELGMETAHRKRIQPGGFHFPPLQCSITADEIVRRAIVFEPGRGFALQFGHNSLGQRLAQFHAPLVKRVNVPNRALREDAVFVKRDELAQH